MSPSLLPYKSAICYFHPSAVLIPINASSWPSRSSFMYNPSLQTFPFVPTEFYFLSPPMPILGCASPVHSHLFTSANNFCRCNHITVVDPRRLSFPVFLYPSSRPYTCSKLASQLLNQKSVRRAQKRARIGMLGFHLLMKR